MSHRLLPVSQYIDALTHTSVTITVRYSRGHPLCNWKQLGGWLPRLGAELGPKAEHFLHEGRKANLPQCPDGLLRRSVFLRHTGSQSWNNAHKFCCPIHGQEKIPEQRYWPSFFLVRKDECVGTGGSCRPVPGAAIPISESCKCLHRDQRKAQSHQTIVRLCRGRSGAPGQDQRSGLLEHNCAWRACASNMRCPSLLLR